MHEKNHCVFKAINSDCMWEGGWVSSSYRGLEYMNVFKFPYNSAWENAFVAVSAFLDCESSKYLYIYPIVRPHQTKWMDSLSYYKVAKYWAQEKVKDHNPICAWDDIDNKIPLIGCAVELGVGGSVINR